MVTDDVGMGGPVGGKAKIPQNMSLEWNDLKILKSANRANSPIGRRRVQTGIRAGLPSRKAPRECGGGIS